MQMPKNVHRNHSKIEKEEINKIFTHPLENKKLTQLILNSWKIKTRCKCQI